VRGGERLRGLGLGGGGVMRIVMEVVMGMGKESGVTLELNLGLDSWWALNKLGPTRPSTSRMRLRNRMIRCDASGEGRFEILGNRYHYLL